MTFYRFYQISSIDRIRIKIHSGTLHLGLNHYDSTFILGLSGETGTNGSVYRIAFLWGVFLVAIFHHWFAFLQHPTFFSQGERSYRYIALHMLCLVSFQLSLSFVLPFRYPSFPIFNLLDR